MLEGRRRSSSVSSRARVEVELRPEQRCERVHRRPVAVEFAEEHPHGDTARRRGAAARSARSRGRCRDRRRAAPPTAARRAGPSSSAVDTSEWQMPAPAVIRFSSPGRTIACTPALSRCSTSPAEQPADRLQPGVRMRRHVHAGAAADVVRPVVVGEAPRPDQRPLPLRQGAPHPDRPRTAQRHVRGMQHAGECRCRTGDFGRRRRRCCSRGHSSLTAVGAPDHRRPDRPRGRGRRCGTPRTGTCSPSATCPR